jgi:hypothetical protein
MMTPRGIITFAASGMGGKSGGMVKSGKGAGAP